MKFSQATSTSVFRGVSDADCLRQAEADGAEARAHGYEPLSQSWSDDAGLRVLTVVYRYVSRPIPPIAPSTLVPRGSTARPTTPRAPAASARRESHPFTALALIVVVAFVALYALGIIKGPQAPGSQAAPAGSLSGAFIRWVPVDDANGYAYFSVTNSGGTAATAKCTVSVSDDFGDFGFDSLVGESVAPGQTVNLKMAIGMGKGSRLVNHGTVKNC